MIRVNRRVPLVSVIGSLLALVVGLILGPSTAMAANTGRQKPAVVNATHTPLPAISTAVCPMPKRAYDSNSSIKVPSDLGATLIVTSDGNHGVSFQAEVGETGVTDDWPWDYFWRLNEIKLNGNPVSYQRGTNDALLFNASGGYYDVLFVWGTSRFSISHNYLVTCHMIFIIENP